MSDDSVTSTIGQSNELLDTQNIPLQPPSLSTHSLVTLLPGADQFGNDNSKKRKWDDVMEGDLLVKFPSDVKPSDFDSAKRIRADDKDDLTAPLGAQMTGPGVSNILGLQGLGNHTADHILQSFPGVNPLNLVNNLNPAQMPPNIAAPLNNAMSVPMTPQITLPNMANVMNSFNTANNGGNPHGMPHQLQAHPQLGHLGGPPMFMSSMNNLGNIGGMGSMAMGNIMLNDQHMGGLDNRKKMGMRKSRDLKDEYGMKKEDEDVDGDMDMHSGDSVLDDNDTDGEDKKMKGKRGRKKNQHPPKEHTREGKWSAAEKQQLEDVVRRVLNEAGYQLYEEGLRILLDRKGKLPENLKGAWRKIYDAMGDRKEKSVYHCAYRLLTGKMSNPTNNHKWTPEEEDRLKNLVDQHGKCWSKCGFALNRPPWACRDKWRLIKEDYSQGTWKPDEDAKLLELVKPYLTENGGKNTIDWARVSQQIGSRSHISCRRRWVTVHAQIVAQDDDSSRARFTREDDAAIIDFIYNSGANDLSEVRFGDIPSKYLPPIVNTRFTSICRKEIPNFRMVPFRQALERLREVYSDVSPDAIQLSLNAAKQKRDELERSLYQRVEHMQHQQQQHGVPNPPGPMAMMPANLANPHMPTVISVSQSLNGGMGVNGMGSIANLSPLADGGMGNMGGQAPGMDLGHGQLEVSVIPQIQGQQGMPQHLPYLLPNQSVLMGQPNMAQHGIVGMNGGMSGLNNGNLTMPAMNGGMNGGMSGLNNGSLAMPAMQMGPLPTMGNMGSMPTMGNIGTIGNIGNLGNLGSMPMPTGANMNSLNNLGNINMGSMGNINNITGLSGMQQSMGSMPTMQNMQPLPSMQGQPQPQHFSYPPNPMGSMGMMPLPLVHGLTVPLPQVPFVMVQHGDLAHGDNVGVEDDGLSLRDTEQ